MLITDVHLENNIDIFNVRKQELVLYALKGFLSLRISGKISKGNRPSIKSDLKIEKELAQF